MEEDDPTEETRAAPRPVWSSPGVPTDEVAERVRYAFGLGLDDEEIGKHESLSRRQVERVRAALGLLRRASGRDRIADGALIAHVDDGRTATEIASATGLSQWTVKRRLRALGRKAAPEPRKARKMPHASPYRPGTGTADNWVAGYLRAVSRMVVDLGAVSLGAANRALLAIGALGANEAAARNAGLDPSELEGLRTVWSAEETSETIGYIGQPLDDGWSLVDSTYIAGRGLIMLVAVKVLDVDGDSMPVLGVWQIGYEDWRVTWTTADGDQGEGPDEDVPASPPLPVPR
jgi:hypothetical protein